MRSRFYPKRTEESVSAQAKEASQVNGTTVYVSGGDVTYCRAAYVIRAPTECSFFSCPFAMRSAIYHEALGFGWPAANFTVVIFVLLADPDPTRMAS